MADPYQTLGLSPEADEAAVRRRYLELVRRHPPDRSPDRFAEIRAAYEQLRDPVKRLEQRLFAVRADESLEDIIAELRARLRARRIPVETLLSLAES
jgi:curved DNA-binding protein CbpA